jgi:acyl-CoA synthetase (AMP-forming)/AMP-acid ligase II
VDRLADGQPDRVVLTDGYGGLTAAQLREQAYLLAALRRLGADPASAGQLATMRRRRERRIAPQKLPEMLQVVDALPTTMTGLVQKFLLRDRARALVDQQS